MFSSIKPIIADAKTSAIVMMSEEIGFLLSFSVTNFQANMTVAGSNNNKQNQFTTVIVS
jgi:hypothetical protein